MKIAHLGESKLIELTEISTDENIQSKFKLFHYFVISEIAFLFYNWFRQFL